MYNVYVSLYIRNHITFSYSNKYITNISNNIEVEKVTISYTKYSNRKIFIKVYKY